LWGIAEEPFWLFPNGSATSPTSVRARWRISSANVSSEAATSVGADCAGELADAHSLERVPEPVAAPLELERPAGELQAEGGRLGVNAVCPADADVVLVLSRARDHRFLRAVDGLEQERPRLAYLQREGGVDDVRRGQAVVEPAPGWAELGGDGVHEGRKVVLGLALQLRDALGRGRLRVVANLGHGVSGNHAELRPRLERGELDVEPARQPVFVRPDPSHHGSGVARDHRLQSRARAGR
jgi:hypothetical protein